MKPDCRHRRRELVEQYRRAHALKLNELSSGNLSCRWQDGMLISATGSTADQLTEERVVFVGPAGEWQGRYAPSSEWQMHAAIYKSHPDAHGVCHTHSDYCVAVSASHQPLPGFHYLVGLFGGHDVPCVPYSTFGGTKLADDTTFALRDRKACLLGSHGMISYGRTIAEAVGLAHRLEILCRQYAIARSLGTPYILTEEQWREFFAKATVNGYGGHGR
jgi:L-fuculose-phosphate aldolase